MSIRLLLTIFISLMLSAKAGTAQSKIVYINTYDGALKSQSLSESANLPESNDVLFEITQSIDKRGLQIDHLNAKIYWIEELSRTLVKSNFDGSDLESVLTFPEYVHDFGIDFQTQQVFYIHSGYPNSELRRIEIDGSGDALILTTDKSLSNIIPYAGKVYFSEYQSSVDRIARVDGDGANFEVVYTESVDENLYDFDVAVDRIYMNRRDSSSFEEELTSTALDGSDFQAHFSNSDLGFSDLIADPTNNLVVVKSSYAFHVFDFQGNRLSTNGLVSQLLLNAATNFAWDPIRQRIFWLTSQASDIYSMDVLATEVSVLTPRAPFRLRDLQLDPSGSAYFHDPEQGVISSVSLSDKSVSQHIAYDYADPSAMFSSGFGFPLLDSENSRLIFITRPDARASDRKLYFHDLLSNSLRAVELPTSLRLDGSLRALYRGRQLFVVGSFGDEIWSIDLAQPNLAFSLIHKLVDRRIRDIRIDNENDMLYWLTYDFDSRVYQLFRSELSGANTQEVFQGLELEPKSFQIAGGMFYWLYKGFPQTELWTSKLDGTAAQVLAVLDDRVQEFALLFDQDNDGVDDASDACDMDPEKSEPGVCGCGVSDTDSDGDGVLDCQDQCVSDASKSMAGACGCGIAETDANSDGVLDCSARSEIQEVGFTLEALIGNLKSIRKNLSKEEKREQKQLRRQVRELLRHFVKLVKTNSDIITSSNGESPERTIGQVAGLGKKVVTKRSKAKIRNRVTQMIISLIQTS